MSYTKDNIPKELIEAARFISEDKLKKAEPKIEPLGWIYLHHHQTKQGVLRVFWALDIQLNIKGYEVNYCFLDQCSLLNNEMFSGK